MTKMSVRDYAAREGLSLGGVYKRLWEGRVRAVKVDGRWLILITPTGGGPRSPERDCKASAREAGCGQV